MKRITLSDVAADAGVSKTTVSMVLNNNPLVAASTRERVQEAMERLGYVYDRAAASLRRSQTHAVGMVITHLTNPYFAEFAEGIQAELDARGMDVLLGVTGEDIHRQTRLLQSMSGRRVDGVVMIPAHGTMAEHLTSVNMPILLLARRVEGADADYVGADNHTGARAAAEHLIGQHGCRDLAFVGGFSDSSARLERLGGFLAGTTANGIDIPWAHQPTCAPTRTEARNTTKALLDTEHLDGIVCFNDVVAFGVLDALADRGLTPGVEVRVIGFDDIHDAAVSRPALASVAVPTKEAGGRAAELLLSRISGERTGREQVVLPAELRPRETCGCHSKGDR